MVSPGALVGWLAAVVKSHSHCQFHLSVHTNLFRRIWYAWPWLLQALERTAEAGAAIDQYEIEGPDRAELLMDLAEFQLATVCDCVVLRGPDGECRI